MSFKIDATVHSFTNTLDILPLQKKIQGLSTGISTEEYLTATFQWSYIVNKQMHEYKQLVQIYQELITDFEERKYLVYNEVYKQVYLDGCASRRH